MEALNYVCQGITTSKATLELDKQLRDREYRIPSEQIDFVSHGSLDLKRGGSGTVKRGRWLNTTEVAIKMLNNLPEFIDPDEMQSFYKEIRILR
jgi:hypothetical protein